MPKLWSMGIFFFIFIPWRGTAKDDVIHFKNWNCPWEGVKVTGTLGKIYNPFHRVFRLRKSGNNFNMNSLTNAISAAVRNEDFAFHLNTNPEEFSLKEENWKDVKFGYWISFYDKSKIGTFSMSPELCTILGYIDCNDLKNGEHPSPFVVQNQTYFEAVSANMSISFKLWEETSINITSDSPLCDINSVLKPYSVQLLEAESYLGVRVDNADIKFTFTHPINKVLSLSPLTYSSAFTAVPTSIHSSYSMIDLWAECERTLRITTIEKTEIILEQYKEGQASIDNLIENIQWHNEVYRTFYVSTFTDFGITKTKLRFAPFTAYNVLVLSKNLACTLGFNLTTFDAFGEYYSEFGHNITCFNNLQPVDAFKIRLALDKIEKMAISVPLENSIPSVLEQVSKQFFEKNRHDVSMEFIQDKSIMLVFLQREMRVKFSDCLNEAFGLPIEFEFRNRSSKIHIKSIHLPSQKCYIQLPIANNSGNIEVNLNNTNNQRYRRAIVNSQSMKYQCNNLINEVLLPISPELRVPQFIEIGMICGERARKPTQLTPTNYFLLGLEIEDEVKTFLTLDLGKFTFQPSTDANQFFITTGSSNVCKVNSQFGNTAHVLHHKSPDNDPLSPESSKITLLLLIKVPRNQRTQLGPFKVNEKVKNGKKFYECPKIASSQFEILRSMVVDAIGLGFSCSSEQATFLRDIIPNFPGDCEDFLVSSHYTPEEREANLQSFSRCATNNENFQPKSFRESAITPGEPNKCEDDPIKYPYPNPKGKVFQSSAQKLILNVWNSVQYGQSHPTFFQGEPRQVTARLVGIGTTSLSRIKKKATDATLATPNKKRKSKCPKQLSIDSFDRMMIRDLIEDFYKKGKPPLFDDIYSGFLKKKAEDIASQQQMHEKHPESCSRPDPFPGICKETFAKVLRGMDFKYGRINNRAAVVLRSDITIRRARFLRRMKANRELPSPLPVVYLDETWIDPNQRLEKAWVPSKIINYKDRKTYAFPNHKIGRGPRIIVIGAASDEEGMIMSCLKTQKIQKGAVAHDYHDNVNSESFMEYFIELLDHLDSTGKKYLIVMDNASYHSSRLYPLKSAKKLEKYNWVQSKIGKPGVHLTLPEYRKVRVRHLDEMINTLKQTPELQYELYKVDMEARKRGHEVLRLWPYGCDANPIELIWQTCKQEIRKRNVNQNLDEMVEIAKEVFQTVANATVWAKYVAHVRKIEDDYWRQDGILENIPENIIIPLGMDEDDEEDIFERESAYERSINEAIRAAMEGTLDSDVVVESNGDITVRIPDGGCEDDDQTPDTQDTEYYDFINKGGFEYESSFPMCTGPRPIRRRRLDFNPETPGPSTAGTSSDSTGPGVCDLEDEDDLLPV